MVDCFRGEKKTEKLIKSRKLKKKNRTVKKNRLEFWKNWPVRFGFISLKLKKPNWTEPKQKKNKKNPSQTGKKLNQTEKTELKPSLTEKQSQNQA